MIKKVRKNKYRRIIAAYSVFIMAALFVSAFCYYLATKEPAKIIEETTKTVESIPVPELVVFKKIICLDPGHGGVDKGASYKDIDESVVNLEVALQTKSILEKDGYKVYLTRTGDDFLAKRDRAYYCNSKKADILVSIHHNSYEDDHTVNYATVLYYKDADQSLASSVLSSTSQEMEVKNRGISKFDNSLFWVANMPAVLVEAFFITNSKEYASLSWSSSARPIIEATGIATGIVNYFTNPESVEVIINDDPLAILRPDLGD